MDILVILVDSHQTMTGVGTLAAKGKWTTHHLWAASGAHSNRHWWPLLVSLYLYYWDLFYGTGCLNQSFSVPSSLFLYFVFSFSSLPSPYHDLCGPIHNFFKILYFWITISWNVTFSSCDMYKLCYFTNYFLSCVIWPLKKHVNLKKNHKKYQKTIWHILLTLHRCLIGDILSCGYFGICSNGSESLWSYKPITKGRVSHEQSVREFWA